MGSYRPTHRDQVVGAIADRHYGVVSREQLLAAGLTARVIDRSIAAGRLRPVFRSVTRSASARLDPFDALVIDDLRVTTPARTIVDLAAMLEGRALRDVVERAQDLRRFDPEDIRATLARAPRRPGTRRLQDLITLLAPDKDNTRSHLERLFLRLVRTARLPKPACNHEIAERRRDFVWPQQRLVVEADGYRFHSSRQAKRRDNRRDRQLSALGWRPVRFTYEEIAFEPSEVAQELAVLLELP
jgi:very-short-patch-repair endonuclease